MSSTMGVLSELSRVSTSRAVLGLAMALMALGTVMVFSATAGLDASLPESAEAWVREWSGSTALRQMGFSVVAAVVMLVAAACPYRLWSLHGERSRLLHPLTWLLVLTLLGLVLVYVPGIGIERNGARRWIRIGPSSAAMGFQPSELAKLALVLFLAAWMSRPQTRMKLFRKGLLPACAVLGLLVGLAGLEDLGTAALLVVVGGGLLLAGGARIRHLALLSVPAVATFAYLLISRPFRLRRLVAFTDIWADPAGSGFHPIQSLLTITSGGWTGRGLGLGVQKLGYLPEAHSDFIFAVICEELGFAGGALVIALFLALVWCGRQTMSRATDDLGRYIALGVTLMIGTQAAINIGVVTVSLPTTGIALPLVSAGGSGVVMLGVAVGLLASVARGSAASASEAPGVYGVPRAADGARPSFA